jgi:hypothetical protein
MTGKWFKSPVEVRTDTVGVWHDVKDVEAAYDTLLQWKPSGPAYRKALKTCRDGYVGNGPTPEDCRAAFEKAAAEGGKLRSG